MKSIPGAIFAVVFLFGAGAFGAHAAEINSQEYFDEIINGLRGVENQSYAQLCIGSLPNEDNPIRAQILGGPDRLQVGETLNLDLFVQNLSTFTVVDVEVIINVYRVNEDEELREQVGDHLVDQVPATTISALNAEESQTISIEWLLPSKLPTGSYYAVISLVGSDSINFVGLPNTNNPAFFGPLHQFFVESTVTGSVVFDTKQTLVNAVPYSPLAALPLLIPQGAPGVVNAVLKNNMPSAQHVEITWEVYSRDTPGTGVLIETHEEVVVIERGEETHIGYSVTDSLHPSHYVVTRAKYNDGTPILLTTSFTHNEQAPAGLTFATLSEFPFKNGEEVTLALCAHNPDLLYTLNNTVVEVEVRNSREQVIAQTSLERPTHQMFEPLIVPIIPERGAGEITVTASVYSDDALVDRVSIPYSCDVLKGTAGCKQMARTRVLIQTGVFLVVVAIAFYVSYRTRKRKSNNDTE